MRRLVAFPIVALLSAAAFAQTTLLETVPVKPLVPTGTLGTCAYKPTDAELPFYKKLDTKETVTGSFMKGYSIHGKRDKFVSWFGIVRGVKPVAGKADTYELLLEQKYFDGMTDCHIMLVSEDGSGDFSAMVNSKDATIPALGLIRVYGKVVSEDGGYPHIEAQYVRIWPWFTFTLTDLGAEDHSNPRWKKVCHPCQGQGRVYNPYPTEDYYMAMLGDPKDYGQMLPQDEWPK